jgi:hypothetical protein
LHPRGPQTDEKGEREITRGERKRAEREREGGKRDRDRERDRGRTRTMQKKTPKHRLKDSK